MKKSSTVQAFSNEILKEQKLTIGLDLGDRWAFNCVLDEAGKIILEQKVATTPEVIKLSERARHFLQRRHNVQSRGTLRFVDERVFGELRVIRLCPPPRIA